MSQERIGDWIQTYTGRQFWPLDPRTEDVCIEDIAHALSNLCRFTGHVTSFYSVAEHSVRVSHIVPREDALWALLHDASEAYLTDLPRPLKHSSSLGPLYRAFEDKLQGVICDYFGLQIEIPATVKHADNVMLATEKRDLMARSPYDSAWEWLPEPIPAGQMLFGAISPIDPYGAEQAFLRRFRKLTQVERSTSGQAGETL